MGYRQPRQVKEKKGRQLLLDVEPTTDRQTQKRAQTNHLVAAAFTEVKCDDNLPNNRCCFDVIFRVFGQTVDFFVLFRSSISFRAVVLLLLQCRTVAAACEGGMVADEILAEEQTNLGAHIEEKQIAHARVQRTAQLDELIVGHA